jgi:hypothetical protein
MLVGSMAGNYWGVPRSTRMISIRELSPETIEEKLRQRLSVLRVSIGRPIETHAIWKGPPFETKQRPLTNRVQTAFWLTAGCESTRDALRHEPVPCEYGVAA